MPWVRFRSADGPENDNPIAACSRFDKDLQESGPRARVGAVRSQKQGDQFRAPDRPSPLSRYMSRHRLHGGDMTARMERVLVIHAHVLRLIRAHGVNRAGFSGGFKP
jgi:hypothetical protein